MRLFVFMPLALAVACSSRGALSDELESGAGPEESAASSVETTASDSMSDSSATADAATDGGSNSSTGVEVGGVECGFVGYSDQDPSCESCNPTAADDCREGEKCVPAVCGSESWPWEGFYCVPIQGDAAVGEACTRLGSDFAGQDTCAPGGVCWDVDDETGIGVCFGQCTNDVYNPECPDGQHCWAGGQDMLPNLCVDDCSLLMQDCGLDQVCLPNDIGPGARCIAEGSDDTDYGSLCEYLNACPPGQLCFDGARVPELGCGPSTSCCTPMCDLASTEPCPGDGQFCVPLFDADEAPGGQENVGVCAVPEGP